MSLKKRAVLLSFVVVIIILVSILSIIYMKDNAQEGVYAKIYQNDILIKTIDITNVDEPYTIKIDSEDGGYNIIEVKEGAVGVIEATCPDGLCMDMGYIDSSLMPVICLPNHLTIKIEGKDNNDLDGVAR